MIAPEERERPGAAADPAASSAPDISAREAFERLLGLARPHAGLLLGATLLLALMSAGGLAVPRLAGEVVDVALEDADPGRLRWIVGGMIGLFAVIGLIGFLESYLLGLARARILRDLRDRFFGHLLGLSAAFFDARRVGEVLSRLASDLVVVEGSLTNQIPLGIQALLRFAGTLVILLVLQARLTLVALLVVPPVVLVAIFVGVRVERLSKRVRDTTAESTALADEVLVGIRTVQASDAADDMRGRYRGTIDEVYGVQVRSEWITAIFSGAVTFAGFTAFALVLGYGGQLMLEGRLTAGELTTFLLYTFSIAMSVGQLGGLYASWRNLKGACARMFEILDTRPAVVDPASSGAPPAPYRPRAGEAPRLLLEDVRFAYGADGAEALSGVTVAAEPGSTIALVGPSGSGKSTLFALLLRFYDPTSGRVKIDGRDVREMSLGDLRRAIGYVPQEVFLFSGTVAENLRLGRPEATDAEVRAALDAAGAREFVEALGGGIEAEIGERGTRLSGGQRQRLAIARAFLQDPAILLLDEATSALDPDSEARVQDALARLFRGRTTLVIAHRLATARRADAIHVLEDGEVKAVGRHADLIESNALYRRYWTLQSLERGDDEVAAGA